MRIINDLINTLRGVSKEEVITIAQETTKPPFRSCELCGIGIGIDKLQNGETVHYTNFVVFPVTLKGKKAIVCSDCYEELQQNPTLEYWFNPTCCSSCGIAIKVVYEYGTEHAYSYKSLTNISKRGEIFSLCSDCLSFYQKMKAQRDSFTRITPSYIKIDQLMDKFLKLGDMGGLDDGISTKDLLNLSII